MPQASGSRPRRYDNEEECEGVLQEIIMISSDEDDKGAQLSKRADTALKKLKTPRRNRRIVESSDEDTSPEQLRTATQVIDITDSSSEDEAAPERSLVSRPSLSRINGIPKLDFASVLDDGAILVWDAPRSPKKPLRAVSDLTKLERPIPPSTPKRPKAKPSDGAVALTPTKTPRTRPNSKKAQAEALHQRLSTFAQDLFNDLNHAVFEDGLPADLELVWSKTLQVTAGRASYKRNRNGEETAKIELAVKVLDHEDRVKHTLAHEMCHLACWMINKKHNENHGPLFKAWGARVESRRPDIVISTTHNYEISYKYSWKCEICDFVYGRHSKSIKPDDLCGRCKKGSLIPLFTQRARKAPETPKMSRMAPSRSQDSPLRSPKKTNSTVIREKDDIELSICSIHDSDREDSDSDIEVLATLLGTTSLS